MATDDFPEEILIEIFSRLPAKSVGRCRCLAKQWQTLLSTPQFIKFHLTQKPHEENLILVSPTHSIHSISDVKGNAVSRRLEFPDSSIHVVVSCDGLVLMVNRRDEKFLLNPVTLQLVKLPDSPAAIYSVHGLGYDRTVDDYKIVTVSCYKIGLFVDVYYVKTGVWKRVDSLRYDHVIDGTGVYVNGAIHWLARDRESGDPKVIAAFDLADEVIDEIPAPSGVVGKFVFDNLLALEGCLCIMNTESVWIMKDYGVRESWTEFKINAECGRNSVKPLCFLGNDEILFVKEGETSEFYYGDGDFFNVTYGETLVVYDVSDGSLRDMVVDGDSASFIDGCTFVESLVSPLQQMKVKDEGLVTFQT